MRKLSLWKIVPLALLLTAGFCIQAFGFENRFLTDVRVQPDNVDLGKAADVQIAWQQSVAGAADVMICDLDGNIVRTLVADEPRAAGSYTVDWDGKESNGQTCPVGIYLPIIKIKTGMGQVNVHNPTSSDWGTELVLEPPVYDIRSEKVTFHLQEPALCLLRIGKVKGGPAYGTLLNWVPRPAGDNQVAWDGWDAQHVVRVGQRNDLTFRLITIAAPKNSILVVASPASGYPPGTGYRHFPLHPPHGPNVYIHATHRRAICRDFVISAKAENAGRKWWGGQTARGDIRINVALENNPNYGLLEKEHFEIYLYVDDQFVREEKRKSVPSAIILNTHDLSNGPHIVTVGLRTLEDHLGAYTMKIDVDN